VRTDQELKCPGIDAGLRARGRRVDGRCLTAIPEDDLIEAVADAESSAHVLQRRSPARVIDAAPKLKGIVKYGVGVDAIDIPAGDASRHSRRQRAGICGRKPSPKGAFAPDDRAGPSGCRRSPRRCLAKAGFGPEQTLAGTRPSLARTLGLGRLAARSAAAWRAWQAKGFSRPGCLASIPVVDAATMHTAGIEKVDDLQSMLRVCDFYVFPPLRAQ